MKIAIHEDTGSFSDRWIKYCIQKDINYKIVCCYDSDIISQLEDCNGLMWHWTHNDYKADLFAKQLILSLERNGIKVFPNVKTAWHFNDKVGQKYLLESIGAPLVKTHIFYSKNEALKWVDEATFPKVFKLRGGAGSVNVRLVKTKWKAKWLVNKAFGKGFLHINRIRRLKDRGRVLKQHKDINSLRGLISGIARIFLPTEVEKFSSNEKGYIYFQDFIPGQDSDIRLVVIGNHCFGAIRYCREGDFRASGGGISNYNHTLIDKSCVQLAFIVAKKLNAQSIAFDIIMVDQQPKIIEISYCFPLDAADNCEGYWDSNLNWFPQMQCPQIFMIEDFIKTLKVEGSFIQ